MGRGRPPRDYTGVKIGCLTASSPTDGRDNNAVVWRMTCDCGAFEYRAPAHLLTKKIIPVCEHARKGRPATDLAGVRCGYLVPREIVRRTRNGECVWLCDCDCGATMTTRASRLTRGASRNTLMCVECAADRRRTPDGYRIRDARMKARLSTTEAAAKIGISHQRLSAMENQIKVRECDYIISMIEKTHD